MADIRRLAIEGREEEWRLEYSDGTTGSSYTAAYDDPDAITPRGGSYERLPWNEDTAEIVAADIEARLSVFDSFFEANVPAFETLSDFLQGADAGTGGVAGALVTARSEHISTVQDTVNNRWEGLARDYFRDFFLNKLAAKAEFQAIFAVELARVADAHRAVLEAALEDALSLAKSVKSALEGDGGGFQLSDAFTVVGIAVSVAFPGAPAALGAAIAAGGLIASLTERSNNRPTPEEYLGYSITGNRVLDILDSMEEEVGKLLSAVEVQEEILGDDLRDDIALFDGEGREEFLVDRPNVAGDFDLNEFSPTQPELAVTVDDLYKAGFVYLPAVAYDYEDARTRLSRRSEIEPLAFNRWFGSTHRLWDGACFRLSGVLSSTVHRLMDAGDALCDIAIHYAEQEGRSAAELRALGDVAGEQFREGGDYTLNNPPAPIGYY